MKKIAILSIALVGLSLASCKKDRTCTCTTTGTTLGVSASSENKVTYTKAKKKDAKAACVDSKWTQTGGSGAGAYTTDYVKSCTLS